MRRDVPPPAQLCPSPLARRPR